MKTRIPILTVMIFCFLVINSLVFIYTCERCKASGNDIYVDDNSYLFRDGTAEHPYRTIREAINLANSGDTIYVFGGTYNETLSVNKRVTLIGSIDEGDTIINRLAEHKYTVEITADYVIFESFTLMDSGDNIISNSGALLHITADNVIVQSNNISYCVKRGICLESSNGDTIGNNNINNNSGVYLYSSHNNVLSNNNILDCSVAAVKMTSSDNNIIYNNNLNDSTYGVYTKGCVDTNISDNTIDNNDFHGIGLYQDSNSIIWKNTISNNNGDGIHLDSFKSKIIGNTIDNNQIGIYLEQSEGEISSNYINNSRSFGISAVSWSKNNIIYLNHFTNNNINAKEQDHNQWDNESSGNYWDDYNEVDEDLDGIGDTPYIIAGGGQDRYPLGIFLQPPSKPSNPSPSDDAESVGLKVTFQVDVYDPDGDMMDVYFYNAADDSLLDHGIDYNVVSGNSAICIFTLAFDTTFAWYVVADDGKLQNQSNIWFFVTKGRPPENEKPVADPGGPYEVDTDEAVTFDASGSNDPDGTIDFYRWNFGDGSSEILDVSPAHSYSSDGTYTVTLTVVDNDGRSDTNQTTVTYLSSSNQPPVADVGGPYLGWIGESITFDGSNGYDTDGTIESYIWDFDDESTGSGVSINHTYSTAGTYWVTLSVTDDDGDTDSSSIAVVISPLSSGGLFGFDPLGFGLMMCVIVFVISLIIPIVIGIWMFKDAKKRGKSGVVWLLVGFFLSFIGLIIWLVVRRSIQEESGEHEEEQSDQYGDYEERVMDKYEESDDIESEKELSDQYEDYDEY